MIVRKLAYRQFRNIDRLELEPGPTFNIVWGDNAQGKTNFLEGLYLLAHLKSFRAQRGEELIKAEATEARVVAEIDQGNIRHRVELRLQERRKEVSLDGKPVERIDRLVSAFRAVLFAPEEIGMLRGSPQARRALVDRALFQLDAVHLRRVQHYERILRQRNTLLRQKSTTQELAPWTEALVKSGEELRSARRRFIAELMPWLQRSYSAICGDETLTVRYAQTETEGESFALGEELQRLASRERALGQTLAGPHRDDIRFAIDERTARQYGSQGQLRSVLLAFKTAQLAQLRERSGHAPVLLLDDMTSELDRKRQDRLYAYLQENGGQVFVTTTTQSGLPPDVLADARQFRMHQGQVIPDER